MRVEQDDISQMYLRYISENDPRSVVGLCRLTGRSENEFHTILADSRLTILLMGKGDGPQKTAIVWQYARPGRVETYEVEIHDLYFFTWLYKTLTAEINNKAPHNPTYK